VTRRNVDQEEAYLSVSDSLEVFADGLYVWAINVGNARLYHVPCCLDELVQAVAAYLSVDQDHRLVVQILWDYAGH
jgi:hypothetical protein